MLSYIMNFNDGLLMVEVGFRGLGGGSITQSRFLCPIYYFIAIPCIPKIPILISEYRIGFTNAHTQAAVNLLRDCDPMIEHRLIWD